MTDEEPSLSARLPSLFGRALVAEARGEDLLPLLWEITLCLREVAEGMFDLHCSKRNFDRLRKKKMTTSDLYQAFRTGVVTRVIGPSSREHRFKCEVLARTVTKSQKPLSLVIIFDEGGIKVCEVL